MDRLLQSDIALKLLAVLVACIVWFLATGEVNPTVPYTFSGVPVNLENLEPGLTVIETEPKTVDVKVEGPRQTIERLDRSDFSVTADLRGVGEGWQMVSMSVQVPPGVEIARVEPRQLRVRVDSLQEKQVPVKVEVTGELTAQYERGELIVKPTDVLVSGPSQKLEDVDHVVGMVDIGGATEDIVKAVPVKPVNGAGEEVGDVALRPVVVDIVIPITKLPPSQIVPVRVVLKGEPAEGYRLARVECRPRRVTVRAPQEVLDSIGSIETAPVDIQGTTENRRQSVGLVVPGDVVSVDPQVVTVTAFIEQVVGETTFEGVTVEARDLAEGLSASVEPASTDVTLRGPQIVLSALEADDVRVYVDLGGLTAGRYEIQPEVEAPEGVEASAAPGSVTVVIAVEEQPAEERRTDE